MNLAIPKLLSLIVPKENLAVYCLPLVAVQVEMKFQKLFPAYCKQSKPEQSIPAHLVSELFIQSWIKSHVFGMVEMSC